jgi:predicted DsbA family dithiol-disulfide isomerase
MKQPLLIEIGFDFICPWCLIGLRHLQAALRTLHKLRPDVEAQLYWRGVQLLPLAPAQGWPFHEFYLRRLGGEAALRQRQGVVQAAAEAAGVQINYGAIGVMPNTADAHRLLEFAGRHGSAAQRDALLEGLFRGYFENGDDLGDRAVLLAHGAALGFEPGELQAVLQGADIPYAGGAGSGAAGGVPSYSIGGRLALSGAQPPDVMLAALLNALDRDPIPA